MVDQAARRRASRWQRRLTLWVWWLLAGGVSGLAASTTTCVSAPLAVALFGCLFALPQWLLLWQHGLGVRLWIPATWLGALPGYIIAPLIFVAVASPLGPLLRLSDVHHFVGLLISRAAAGGAAGTVVGFSQYALLSDQLPRAKWWIAASAAGGMVVAPTAGAPWLRSTFCEQGDFIGGVLSGAAYGAITGLALAWLLRDEPPRA